MQNQRRADRPLRKLSGDELAGKGQPNAVRVSLGAASGRAELVRALEILSTALKSSAAGTSIV
jgi:hypothetical protein